MDHQNIQLRKRKFLMPLYLCSKQCSTLWNIVEVYCFSRNPIFSILCVEKLHCSPLRMEMVVTMVQSLWCLWCILHIVHLTLHPN